MNSERLLTALGQVDDDLLQLCDTFTPTGRHPLRWASAAACIAALVISTVFATHTKKPAPPVQSTTSTELAAEMYTETPSATTPATSTVSDITQDVSGNLSEDGNQIHLPMIPYEGTTQKQHGDGSAQAEDKHTAVEETDAEAVFNKAPFYSTKYPTLLLNGSHYTSRGTSKPVLGQQLKIKPTLTGFDGVHKTLVEVYQIKGISTEAAVAVRFPEVNEVYTYVNTEYTPKNLGQFMDDLNLSEYLTFGKVYFGPTNYTSPPESEIRKLLNRSAAFSDNEKLWLLNDIMYIDVNVPVLGYTNHAFMLTNDGYLLTSLLESSKAFYIGKDRVQSFVQYVYAHSGVQPTLAVTTTQNANVRTSAAHQPDTAPAEWNVIECY